MKASITKKRKAGGLDALRNLSSEADEIIVNEANTTTPKIVNKKEGVVIKTKPKNFPYLLHPSVHDLLREIAHVERRSMTSVINEGLDMFLKSRAQPSIEEIKKK